MKFDPDFASRVNHWHLLNPWFDHLGGFAFLVLLVGGVFLWVHYRLHESPLFRGLGYSLAGNGLFLLVFMRTPDPHPLLLVVEVAVIYLTFVDGVALVSTIVARRLPEYDVDERYVFDADKQLVQPYLVPGVAFAIIFGIWMCCDQPFTLLGILVGGLLSWVVLAASLTLVTVAASARIPYVFVRGETALLSESAPPREVENLLTCTGPASPMEKIAVPVLVLALWAVIYYFSSGSGGTSSWIGVVILVILASSIAFTEYRRARSAAPGASQTLESIPKS